MKRGKRSYLLLELVIALTLVVTCALPLVRAPLSLVKGEIQSFQRMEAIRLGQIAFGEILAKLHRNEIPWDLITCERKTPLFQEEMEAHLEGVCKQTFLCTSDIQCVQQKTGKNNEDLRLVKITLTLETKSRGNLWLMRSDQRQIHFYHEVFVIK